MHLTLDRNKYFESKIKRLIGKEQIIKVESLT